MSHLTPEENKIIGTVTIKDHNHVPIKEVPVTRSYRLKAISVPSGGETAEIEAHYMSLGMGRYPKDVYEKVKRLEAELTASREELARFKQLTGEALGIWESSDKNESTILSEENQLKLTQILIEIHSLNRVKD